MPLDQLEKEERAALILVLLKQLQPHLTELNLDAVKSQDKTDIQKFLSNVNIQRQINPTPKSFDDVTIDKSGTLPRIIQHIFDLI